MLVDDTYSVARGPLKLWQTSSSFIFIDLLPGTQWRFFSSAQWESILK